MAGVDLIVAGEGAEPAQRLHLVLCAAAGEIAAAAGAFEQRVAGEKRFAADKAHAAGSVSRGGDDLKMQRVHIHAVAVVIEIAALGRRVAVRVVLGGLAGVAPVHPDRRAGLFRDGGDRACGHSGRGSAEWPCS